MTIYSTSELNRLFHALSNGYRRQILLRLHDEGRYSISQLAAPFDISLAAISKHVSVLVGADLIKKKQEGQEIYCSIKTQNLEGVLAYLEHIT